ncbi:hypothetical protein MKW92_040934 [Papaver armeniacum]|nr:hypothetical protein MKW92_040934 [Papaver armeniacum]
MLGMTQALTTQFKSCRLLLRNVWHKQLLYNVALLENLGARRDPGVGDVVANQNKTRLDVLLIRTHQSIPLARQLISHRRVCVNIAVRSINRFKVSPGEVISFQNNAVSAEIRRSPFCSVLKIMALVQNQPFRMVTPTIN